MAYCTPADAAALVGFSPSDGPPATTPSATTVELFCTLIAAEIDTALSVQGVSTPVVSPVDAAAVCRYYNMLGAAWLTEEAAYTQQSPNESSRGSRWRDLYRQWLADIREHPGKLTGELLGTIAYNFAQSDNTFEPVDEATQF